MVTVAVAGASGYAGGELLRYLAYHPKFDVVTVSAASRAGETLGEVHPQFVGTNWGNMPLRSATPQVLGESDVAFLALPHGESAAIVRDLPESQKVIDLGADFRLADAQAWTHYYGGEHPGTWPYGLPELPGAREAIASATRVANPGCYPTSVAVAMAPLLRAGVGEPRDVVVVAASGTSGAGRRVSDALLASTVLGDISAYKVGGVHQHTPEMEQTLSSAANTEVKVSFTPMLAPIARGILATCSMSVDMSVDVHGILADAYRDEPFVTVLPRGQWPHVSSVAGTNQVHLQGAYDEHSRRVVVVSCIDNLGKGAAGQAVQNANIVCGFDETLGLTLIGASP